MTGAVAAVVLAALLALAASPAAASERIRVAIVDSARSVELRGADIEVTELGAPCLACAVLPRRTAAVRATVSAGAVEIDGVRAPGGFRLQSDKPVRFNGREYPAPLDIVRNGDGLALVNELPLEEYLVGVLRAESSEKWSLEALCAQAIVARTYAAYQCTLAVGKPYHIIASTAH